MSGMRGLRVGWDRLIPRLAGVGVLMVIGLGLGAAPRVLADPPKEPVAAPVPEPEKTVATPDHPAEVNDGPAFPVSRFDIRYKTDNSSLPPLNALTAFPITLGVLNG